MKKAASRSQRGSKGIKGKHVLQICVLLGVCIWLIYQVKYSHDKNHQFYEKDGEKLSEDRVVKLGRKDLLPSYHNQKENEKLVEEDEEEISHGGEDKEKKSKVEDEKEEEDEDAEDKNKQEEVAEKDDEDEIDEQDHTDKDEEEKQSGSHGKDKESNRVDEIDITIDEVREEHYKADDASSAVSHESRISNSENSSNGTMSKVEVLKGPDLKLGEAKSADFLNKTTTEVKDGDSEPPGSETKRVVTESQDDTVNDNSTEAILEGSGLRQNETETIQDRSQEDGALPVFRIEQTRNESDPNVIVSANITNKDYTQDESSNSTSEFSLIENISGLNTTDVKDNSRSIRVMMNQLKRNVQTFFPQSKLMKLMKPRLPKKRSKLSLIDKLCQTEH